MFARLARYDVPPERIDDAIKSFAEAGQSLAQLDGMEGGYVLIDPDTGKTLTLTFWRNQTLMDASETRATLMRQKAARAADGSVEAIDRYEVAVTFGSGQAD